MKIKVKFQTPTDLSYETTGLNENQVEIAQRFIEKCFKIDGEVLVEIDTETGKAEVIEDD